MVIAIIAILAAMLLPALAKAKQKGQSTVCLNDLKQVGLAMLMFADENEDMVPRGTAGNSRRWWLEFMPFVPGGRHGAGLPEHQDFHVPELPHPQEHTEQKTSGHVRGQRVGLHLHKGQKRLRAAWLEQDHRLQATGPTRRTCWITRTTHGAPSSPVFVIHRRP